MGQLLVRAIFSPTPGGAGRRHGLRLRRGAVEFHRRHAPRRRRPTVRLMAAISPAVRRVNRQSPSALAGPPTGLGLLGFFVLVLLAAPLITPNEPIFQNPDVRLVGPSLAHPFGTDNFSRDILSRSILGTRLDLQIAGLGVVFPFLLGTTIGTVAGSSAGSSTALHAADRHHPRLPVPRADALHYRHSRARPFKLLHRPGAGRLGFLCAADPRPDPRAEDRGFRGRRREPGLFARARCSATSCPIRWRARWSSPCPTRCWSC